MSVELVKEPVRIIQSIDEDTVQMVVENDIIVPDVKPDISRILLLDGDAWTTGAEAAVDRITVDGAIRYKIIYLSDNPGQPIKSIVSTSGFQYSVDVPNARQNMRCRAKCNIEHIEYEILNSRKVGVKAVVSIRYRVAAQAERHVTSDFEGVGDIQVLRCPISVNSYIGDRSTGCQVKEMLDVPAGKPGISEILRCDAKIASREFKATEGKIEINGELGITTLYISDDGNRSIQFMEHEMPFEHTIEILGIDENSSCSIDAEPGEIFAEVAEDADGEPRKLNCGVSLNIYAECFGIKNINMVEDAYSPSTRISLEKENLQLDEVVSESKSQAMLKEIVEIDDTAPEILEIFNLMCKLSLSGSEVTDDRIIIEGLATSSILYLAGSSDQPVYCVNQEIPFKHPLEIKNSKAGMGLEVEMDVEHCSYSLASAKEIELRLVIGINARVIKQVSVPVISKALEQPPDEKKKAERPSIVVYFVQPGDTPWKIAKKYCTTVDELARNNGFETPVEFRPGTQLIIPRKS